ncbi:MAG: glutamate--tRNA ligase [Candidatus Puniceispirillales bacterium]
MSRPLVRFAPSPTGNLHVGNMRTALVNFLFARANDGDFMLRIDDTDDERSTAAYEASIREDLTWMGMTWDREDRQSSRLDHYRAALDHLLASGRAYKCFETQEELGLKRKAQLAAGRPPVYDRAALSLTPEEIAAREAAGEKPHYRFKLEDTTVTWHDLVRGEVSVPMSSLSDPVILRADGRVIYTLASVVDDRDHGVTHILRGEDHTTNSAAQIQLFEALGATAPAMGHFALLAGADGEGLSKRLGSLSIGSLRDDGIEAMAIASLLARIGTSDPVEPRATMDDVVSGFDITRFGRATPKFDPAELSLLNGRILGMTDHEAVQDRLAAMGLDISPDFWSAIRGNLSTIADAAGLHAMVTAPLMPVIAAEDREMLAAAAQLLPEGDPEPETWGQWTKAIAAETGRKGKGLFMPLRLALTGQSSGPELAGLLPLMGRQRIITRLAGDEG